MAADGPRSPGSIVNDTGVGSYAWVNPSNAGASDDSWTTVNSGSGPPIDPLNTFNSIRYWDGGGSSGDEKAAGSVSTLGGDAIYTFGGASDTWTVSPTPTTENSSSIGFRIGMKDSVGSGFRSHFLRPTDFGFTRTGTDTIDGIVLEVEASVSGNDIRIDHARKTLYYTPVGGAGVVGIDRAHTPQHQTMMAM